MHFILSSKRITLNEESTKLKELFNKTEPLLSSPPKHQMECFRLHTFFSVEVF